MKTLSLIILAFITLMPSITFSHENTKEYGRNYARQYAKAIRTLDDLKYKTDMSLDTMIKVAAVNMRAWGYKADADQIEYEWNTEWRGAIFTRDIGHIYLSQWLEKTYDKIEKALGVEVCKALHLSDIKTVNCALAVVFTPCSYDMTGVTESRKQDYIDHFAKGAVYYGLAPVITWWGISSGCWVGTAGLGAFACSIAATAAEWTMGDVIAPPLGNRIFIALCGNNRQD